MNKKMQILITNLKFLFLYSIWCIWIISIMVICLWKIETPTDLLLQAFSLLLSSVRIPTCELGCEVLTQNIKQLV